MAHDRDHGFRTDPEYFVAEWQKFQQRTDTAKSGH
jgi:hypothetical protein